MRKSVSDFYAEWLGYNKMVDWKNPSGHAGGMKCKNCRKEKCFKVALEVLCMDNNFISCAGELRETRASSRQIDALNSSAGAWLSFFQHPD